MKQSENRYSTSENILTIGDSKIVLDNKIKDVLEVSDMLILLMVRRDGTFYNENVLGVSLKEKKIKWQIAKLNYGNEDYCPFVGMKFDNNQLYLGNWCDIYLIVDPVTGEILVRSFKVRS